jgi:hypothetical protein
MLWKANGSKTFPKEEDEYEIVEETTEEQEVESPEDLDYNKFWAVSGKLSSKNLYYVSKRLSFHRGGS